MVVNKKFVLFFFVNLIISWQFLSIFPCIIWNIISIFAFKKNLSKYSYLLSIEELMFFLFLSNVLIGGKKFAYVGISPIFISDVFLVLVIGIIFFKHIVNRKMIVYKAFLPYFSLFLIITFYSMYIFLLNANHGINAIRDSVIVLYSLWTVISIYLLRHEHVWKFLKNILIATATFSASDYIIKLCYFFIYKQLPSFEGFRFGAGYIVPSISIFFLLACKRKIGPWFTLLIIILVISNITLFHRSIYLGFVTGIGILFVFLRGRRASRIIYISSFAISSSLIFTFGIYLALGIPSSAIKYYVSSKFSGNDGNISYRTTAWDLAIEKFGEKPIFGYGVGTPLMYEKGNVFFSSSSMGYFEIKQTGGNAQIHNSPLNFLVRYGIFGFSIIVISYFILIHQLINKIKIDRHIISFSMAATIYMLIYSFFNVVLEGPHDGSVFWIILGFSISVAIYKIPKTRDFTCTN